VTCGFLLRFTFQIDILIALLLVVQRPAEKKGIMKRNSQDSATAVADAASDDKRNGDKRNEDKKNKNNGNSGPVAEPTAADLSVILASLQTMRNGDFSVRLPGSWTGLAGKIADTFNSIVAANQQMAGELKRVGQVVGKKAARANAHASMNPGERGARWKFRLTPWLRICFVQLRV
jgi:hypothetical protein